MIWTRNFVRGNIKRSSTSPSRRDLLVFICGLCSAAGGYQDRSKFYWKSYQKVSLYSCIMLSKIVIKGAHKRERTRMGTLLELIKASGRKEVKEKERGRGSRLLIDAIKRTSPRIRRHKERRSVLLLSSSNAKTLGEHASRIDNTVAKLTFFVFFFSRATRDFLSLPLDFFPCAIYLYILLLCIT